MEAPSFLNEYVQNGTQNISPVLFWSMLLAATNVRLSELEPCEMSLTICQYANIEVLQRAGFESRKAMKRAMYRRAKVCHVTLMDEEMR